MLTGGGPGSAGPDPVSAALTRAVADHGRLLLSDPARLQAVLSDVLGGEVAAHRAELDALVVAARCGAASAIAGGAPPDDPQVARQLEAAGLDPDAARWVGRVVVAALPTGMHGVPAGQSSLHPTSPVVGSPSGPVQPPRPDQPTRPDPRAQPNRPREAQGPGAPAAPATDKAAARRRRRLLVATMAGVLVAAGVGVGGTMLVRGGGGQAADVSAAVAVVTVTGAPATSTAGPVASTRLETTRTVTGEPVATRTTVLVAAPDDTVVTTICEPVADVLIETQDTVASWPTTSDPTKAQASTVAAELGAQYNDIGQIGGIAPATASAVPAASAVLRDRLAALRSVAVRGGTPTYSADDWDDALREFALQQQGFEDACAVAGGEDAFGTDTERFRGACAHAWEQAEPAAASVQAWLDSPTAANAVAAGAALRALREATADVREEYRLSTTMPVRQAVHGLDWWAARLQVLVAAQQALPDSWAAGWDRAVQGLEPLC